MVAMNFPNRASLAEILYWPKADHSVRRARVVAQGDVRLPDNINLEVNLTFDGQQQMKSIEQLSRLRVTTFCASQLDFEDEQLTYIKNFKSLRTLNLDQTMISDNSLTVIGNNFKELATLRASGTNITGTTMASLSQLKKLRHLDLSASALKPGSVAKIKSIMPNLLDLHLGRTMLTNDDCASMANLSNATLLDISFNRKIDNKCMAYLAPLKNLQRLSINDTGINDKILPALLKLPKLNTVTIRPKEFWRDGKARSKFKHIQFVDVVSNSHFPAEALSPLH